MQWEKGGCMTSEGFISSTIPHYVLTAHSKAGDVTWTIEIVIWKTFKSWCGLNIKCHVPHELSIITTLFSPSFVSNASLVRIGVAASFVVYQTVKIWQTATLHHILWSVKKFFEDLSYLEEVDFSKSSLLNDHVWWQQRFLCTLKAH